MSNLEKLHKLIRSLDRHEKRYFKQYTNLYSSAKDQEYLHLFNIIKKQKTFNLSALKSKIEKKGINYISIKSQYLYQSILDAVSNSQKKKNSENYLKDQLHYINILEGKGLLEEALSLIKKIKNKLQSSENYALLYEILTKEMEVLSIKNHGSLSQQYITIGKEKNEVFKKIQNINTYEQISLSIMEKFLAHEAVSPEFIQSHLILQDNKYALSKTALTLYYHIHKVLYYAKQDYKEMLNLGKKIIELIPQSFLQPARILSLYQNYFVAAFHLQSPEDIWYGLQQLNRITFEQKQHNAILLLLKNQITLDYFLQEGSRTLKNPLKLYEGLEDFYNEYHSYLHWYRKKLWFYDLICFSIKIEEFNQAETWLNRLLDLPETKKLNDEEQIVLKFLKMIIHYEKNIYSLMESESRAIAYLVKTRKINNPIILESTVLFQLLCKKQTPQKSRLLFQKYNELFLTTNTKIEKSLWSFDFFKTWVNFKAQLQ